MGQKLCAQGDAPLTPRFSGLVSPPFSTHVRFQPKNLKRNVRAREGDFFVRSGLFRRRGGGGKASLPYLTSCWKGRFHPECAVSPSLLWRSVEIEFHQSEEEEEDAAVSSSSCV